MGNLYRVGAYIRLSVDSAAHASDSITNQQELLTQFIAMFPDWCLEKFYVDDGFSGGNFCRPAFLELMEDVRTGKVNLLLVKDAKVKQKLKIFKIFFSNRHRLTIQAIRAGSRYPFLTSIAP